MNVKTKLKLLFLRYSLFTPQIYKKSDVKRVWIFLGADYGNLGDVAITLFQESFLKQKFPNHEVVTVPISKTVKCIPAVKKVIKDTDIVTIIGGGNMSDLYKDIEFLRQLVIKSFSRNRIISFPQSIYLSPTKDGDNLRKEIARIYGSHKNLQILMRDHRSLKLMKEILPDGNVQLAPDIVMVGKRHVGLSRKKRVVVCLRDDKEAVKSGIDNVKTHIDELQRKGYDIVYLDTQIDDKLVRQDGGVYHLTKYLDAISNCSLMITNRLHGMIFAFITGTPAIVMDNSTGKVFATYEWIKECGYIHRVDAYTNIDQLSFTDHFDEVNVKLSKLLAKLIN